MKDALGHGSDAHAAAALASGPKSAPAPTHDSMEHTGLIERAKAEFAAVPLRKDGKPNGSKSQAVWLRLRNGLVKGGMEYNAATYVAYRVQRGEQ